MDQKSRSKMDGRSGFLITLANAPGSAVAEAKSVCLPRSVLRSGLPCPGFGVARFHALTLPPTAPPVIYSASPYLVTGVTVSREPWNDRK